MIQNSYPDSFSNEPGLSPTPRLSATAYPLDARFKFFALSQTVHFRQPSGEMAFCVKQKAFKLKEDIRVFADEAQTRPMLTIKADRMVDWSASYTATHPCGAGICTVRRRGARSLWRATYEVFVGTRHVCTVTEKNPWTKVWDGLMQQLPLGEFIACYLFHPAYIVLTPSGSEVMVAKKLPSLIEGRFHIERGEALTDELDHPALIGVFMTLLLERRRG